MPSFYPQEVLCRRVGEPPRRNASDDPRTPFAKDRDRILYARSFRRLSGKSQVAASTEIESFHTRLTHSLKVAQLGRRIAENLRSEEFEKLLAQTPSSAADAQSQGDEGSDDGGASPPDDSLFQLLAPDPDLVEFACLAHDIGHPPFGHSAEREIHATVNRLIGECLSSWPERVKDMVRSRVGGFEGNPQTLRIVTRLSHIAHGEDPETRQHEVPLRLGLNLTAASIDAVSKYPFRLQSVGQQKWGAYGTPEQSHSDYATLQWAREQAGKSVETGVPVSVLDDKEYRSFECQIMDWCDDVTYAVHDVEDFYLAGLIPLEQIFDDGRMTKWTALDDSDGSESESYNLLALHEYYREQFDKRVSDASTSSGEAGSSHAGMPLDPPIGVRFHSTEWERFREFVKKKWNGKGRKKMNGDPWTIEDADLDRLRLKLIDKFGFANSSSEPSSIEARHLSHNRTNGLITHFVRGVWCCGEPLLHQGTLRLAADDAEEQDLRDQCDLLKELIWMYVINSSGLASQQAGQRRVVRALVEILASNPDLLPQHYQELLETGTVGCEGLSASPMFGIDERRIACIRLAADYVASLSEPHALVLYSRFTGAELGGLRDFV